MEHLRNDSVDVMLADLRLGGENGMDLIEQALKLPHPPICIMMTAYGSVDTAVEAMKRGAYDFVTKPLNLDEVEILIKRALKGRSLEKENVELKKQVERKYTIEGILGKSEVMKPVFEIIEQVRADDPLGISSALLVGLAAVVSRSWRHWRALLCVRGAWGDHLALTWDHDLDWILTGEWQDNCATRFP